MPDPRFYIVDVFAEEKYTGNQLAVFRDVEGLSDTDMQRIAKEMNYSETTFILSEQTRNGGYDVRIFTLEEELPFAGHPTLGTTFVIRQEIIGQPVEKIILNLKVGQIPVNINYSGGQVDMLWMKQIPPTAGLTLNAGRVAPVLKIDENDIEARFPIQEISTGVPTLIVPLKTLDVLKKISVATDKYFELIKDTDAKLILAFCPETRKPENNLSVRVFANYYGVPEDPATGAANGCLAGYLVKHRYFQNDRIDVRVEQGYEIGRPSLLFLRAEDKEGRIDVFVGGKVIMVAEGALKT